MHDSSDVAKNRTDTIFGEGLRVEDKTIYPIIEFSITESIESEGTKGVNFLVATAFPLAVLIAETTFLDENEQIEYAFLPLV
ncbi:MAG TPA: hypothetical protein VFF30_14590 [Nitrososphaerales archaeon]|nr:hypothetical protein [Nitrososphaerales archaeon]